MTATKRKQRIAKAMTGQGVNPVPQPCGCINHDGGEITYCAMHAAAPKMQSALEQIVNRWHSYSRHDSARSDEQLLSAIKYAVEILDGVSK